METTYNKIMADIKRVDAEMGDIYSDVMYETYVVNTERLYKLQAEIQGNIHTLIRTKDCTAIKPIVSCRGFIRPIEILVKRVIRKLTLWLIEPAWEQQKIFNNMLTYSVCRIAETNEELLKGLIYLTKEIEKTKKNENEKTSKG